MNPKLHFLYCGNGDTILVQAGGEWALIDCNLTKRLNVKARLIRLLDQNHVRSLRFVCVTHYDADHLRGLASLLRERFSEQIPGGRVGRRWFVQQIIQPLRANDVNAAGKQVLDGFANLEIALEKLNESQIALDFSEPALDFLSVTKQVLDDNPKVPEEERVEFPTYVAPCLLKARAPAAHTFGPFEICFLAPEQSNTELFEEERFRPFYQKASGQELSSYITSNSVSRVLAFRHRDSSQAVLFAGDAPKPCWQMILNRWAEVCRYGLRPNDPPRWNKFHVVKASHHGAEDSHAPDLYTRSCIPNETIVVVSSLTDDAKHPHPDVLSDLRANGMQVQITGQSGVRTRRRSYGSPPGGHSPSGPGEGADIGVEFMPERIIVERNPLS